MIFKVVPTKQLPRWAKRPWYLPFARRRMIVVQVMNYIYTNPDNLHEVLKEMRAQGLTAKIEIETELPANVIPLTPRPKK